jgi:hypothetical protein
MRNNGTPLKTVCLYDESLTKIDFNGLKGFLRSSFGGISVKVIHIGGKSSPATGGIVRTKGLLYDPVNTARAFAALAAKDKDACHIILTGKLFATCDEFKRLHIRAAVYSYPSAVSIAGMIEGPARPKGYYLYKERYAKLGVWPLEEAKVKKKFKDRFIDYGDIARINEAIKGYISQAIFFHTTGDPFCAKRACRLFNAHRQEDLIYSQIRRGEFCRAHKVMATAKQSQPDSI